MFAKRNSATLAIIWVLLLIVGGFWYLKDANSLLSAVKKETTTAKALAESQAKIKRLTEVETVFASLSKQWADSPKRIISANEPSFTLAYLNRMMAANSLNIYYDFVLNSKAEKNDVTKFSYTLTGEGLYDDINELIWHLTYEPVLYQIRSLSLKGGSRDEDFRKFSATLEGYTVAQRAPAEEDLEAEMPSLVAAGYIRQNDIFKPLLTQRVIAERPRTEKPTLPARKPGEIDLANARLKAVTPNSVFISEGGGAVKQLRIGDRVYLGSLVAIDQRRNQADFLITKYGRSERVTLRIDDRN